MQKHWNKKRAQFNRQLANDRTEENKSEHSLITFSSYSVHILSRCIEWCKEKETRSAIVS